MHIGVHRFRHALPLPSFSSVELERERGRGDILMNLSSLVVKSLYRFFFFPSTANLTHIQKYRGIITFLCSRSREIPSKFGITAETMKKMEDIRRETIQRIFFFRSRFSTRFQFIKRSTSGRLGFAQKRIDRCAAIRAK